MSDEKKLTCAASAPSGAVRGEGSDAGGGGVRSEAAETCECGAASERCACGAVGPHCALTWNRVAVVMRLGHNPARLGGCVVKP